ncbi:hypothetical protein A6U86_10235 [Rhizobium sp. AC27/96]|nr:hypothetical protein A6U86_10235 [Rhizobium sp. AC27/96]
MYPKTLGRQRITFSNKTVIVSYLRLMAARDLCIGLLAFFSCGLLDRCRALVLDIFRQRLRVSFLLEADHGFSLEGKVEKALRA